VGVDQNLKIIKSEELKLEGATIERQTNQLGRAPFLMFPVDVRLWFQIEEPEVGLGSNFQPPYLLLDPHY